ncbi:hypothetical protein GUITHDRAFT_160607 [Guillardia theta CCMP2712]|uniref:Cilia- and flagella-associated protein 91 n=2 Tax=Guillardia theta TaxID=55529 RepID=L1K3B3_GUITC|nr:hypothetical protein GUITHDRAFT_160607 [Guillardia theta CCMP2712]EKX55082.1 hypothetical protein GUITHDRAFT_160607 [Guillardia theta CCMP2712]|mmetsp:Transcript_10436/g.34827  ORF Transcript_10436/g.34827 Transcript_10436/m.34827 type:complete len:638 (+) Transcript_10436:208-2121(+)|eukprot:XP_005842062.1 hypothetical protein GUITHDRAFT_160607 [Guillardia theta CCMP2712]
MTTRAIAVQIERPQDYAFDPIYTVSGFRGGNQGAAASRMVLKLSAVSGANRFKYFRTPTVPSLQTVPPDVLLSVDAKSAESLPEVMVEEEPAVKVASTQTDYRESETQTDPFTPDVAPLDPSAPEPELLQLKDLVWGRGLPAGMAEIEMIERARKRRAFEAALPDIGEDPETWRNMMEMQQMEELARREAEIQALQEQRLELIRGALQARDEETRFVNEQRMEELKDRASAMVEAHADTIHHTRVRQLRKIAVARQSLNLSSTKKRDIIGEYANFNSKVYAPIKREGLRVDRDSHKYETRYLDDMKYQDVLELEESLPRRLTSIKIERPSRTKHKSALEARKEREMQAHLDRMTAIINKKHKAAKEVEEVDDLAEYRKAPVVVRPPTPELRPPVSENDDKRLAVILMQKLLRGRAVQNDMMQAKEKRLQLIKELRTVETLEDRTEQHSREAVIEHQRSIISGHIATAVGREVGQQLDYLNKELVRYKEERRIFAMVMLAERQRTMREAEEKGKREEEERRRAKQDEMYRQVMQVHQGSIDTFLENILGDAIESTSSKQALMEANARATFLNDIVDSLEQEGVTDEDVVKDLVSSFLMPEVSRSDLRTQIQQDQKRLIKAVHEQVMTALGSEGMALTE